MVYQPEVCILPLYSLETGQSYTFELPANVLPSAARYRINYRVGAEDLDTLIRSNTFTVTGLESTQ